MNEIQAIEILKSECECIEHDIQNGASDKKCYEFIDACKVAISALEAQHKSKGVEIDQFRNGWIPVEERLPEMNETYICTIKRFVDGCIYTSELVWYPDSQEWAWWDKPYSRLSDDNHIVLAWMPLPQPMML